MRRLWRPGLLVSRKGHMGMESMSCLLKAGQERSAVQMRNQEGLKLAWWEDLAHRSLGVGVVVDVSDWKGKLQEGVRRNKLRTCWARKPIRSLSWALEEEEQTSHHTWHEIKMPESSHSPAASLSPDETHQQKCPIPYNACANLAKNNCMVALSQICQRPCRGLPVADQNTSALFLICVGIRVVPGHEISAFSICSFTNQYKNCRKALLKLQIQVLQNLRLSA